MIDFYVQTGDCFTCNDADILRNPTGKLVQNALIAVDRSARRTFGVFDADGVAVPGTACEGRPLPGQASLQNADYYDDMAIFCGGDRFFHFGHFLIEGMERAWPTLLKKYKNAKLVYVSSRDSMPGYAIEFLRLLGVDASRVILLNKSARFRELYVPERASHIGQYTSSVQNDVYQTIAKNAGNKNFGDMVYLSRGRMGARSIFGEEQVQRIFEKNGFKIIYPETLSITEQVQLASGAKCIAGIAGSALHLAAFMAPGGRLIQLNRAQHRDNAMIQYLLCRGANVDMTLISASLDTVKKARHGASHPHIIGVTPELKRFFDDNKFKYTAADIADNPGEFEEYQRAVHEYHRRRGAMYKFKRLIVKLIACFVPGYKNRHLVRQYLGRKLGMDK